MRMLAKIALVLSLLPLVSFAEDTVDSCGLGWEVMEDKTLLGTSVRATTNYFVPPSFGMTSGTMGCDKHEIASKDMEKAKYAVTNFETLKLEMAAGQGETLDAFAQVMGCESQNFSKMTEDNFNQIYSSSETSAVEMFKNVQALASRSCEASA